MSDQPVKVPDVATLQADPVVGQIASFEGDLRFYTGKEWARMPSDFERRLALADEIVTAYTRLRGAHATFPPPYDLLPLFAAIDRYRDA